MRARSSSVPSRCVPAGEGVGQVVLGVLVVGQRLGGMAPSLLGGQERGALVVEAATVGPEVVEPDVVGAAGVRLGEQQDGGRHAGVRLEHAARQRDDAVELLVLDEDAAQLLVGLGGPEQHAVGHDHRRPAAGLEQPQEQRQEEQLGLLGLDDLQEVLGGVLVVERAGEGRVGEDQRVRLARRRRAPRRASPCSGRRGARRRAAACSCCRCAASCCRSRSR